MFGKILASAAFIGLICSPVLAQEAPRYPARIEQACASLGLNPTEAPFRYCEISLQDVAGSAVLAAPARHLRVARGDRTTNFSAEWPSTAPLEGVDVSGSYTRGDQLPSVRRACAIVGLAPGSAAYTSCVGDLDATLDDSNRAGND